MKRVVLESPYGAPDFETIRRNILYFRTCLRDSLERGEAPWCSHSVYPQPGILNDNDEHERTWGISAGLAWGDAAELRAVYLDLGTTRGMKLGIERALEIGQDIEERRLSPDLMDRFEEYLAQDRSRTDHMASQFEIITRENPKMIMDDVFRRLFKDLPQEGIWI